MVTMLTEREERLLEGLKRKGFRITPISSNSNITALNFTKGTIRGTLGCLRDASAIYLTTCSNLVPHNGDFDAVLEGLEHVVDQFKNHLYVMHIQSNKLAKHLAKRGYSPFEKNDFYHMVYPAVTLDS